MSIVFAKNPIIIEYNYDIEERTDKLVSYKRVKSNQKMNAWISALLYRPILNKQEYYDIKNKYNIIHSLFIGRKAIIYHEKNFKIGYNIFNGDNVEVTICIKHKKDKLIKETKKFKKRKIYEAKVYLIKRVREITTEYGYY